MRVHLWISGMVQGVGFRFFVERAGRRHAVSGFVRNLADGRVEAVAEGDAPAVEEFVAVVRRGPSGSLVRDVQTAAEPPEGLKGFFIR